MRPIHIGIIGFGKIAQDQHVPSIEKNPRFELAATVSRQGNGHPGVPCFASHSEMLREVEELDAVAVCTPPSVRHEIARDCLEAGLHTLLEKPPGVTLSEVEHLTCLAAARQRSLFATWHARHNAAVAAAAERLAGQVIRSMQIVWHEDVRKWHPGQQWIWEPGGFGVFDPGINALSIATRIFPGELFVRDAELMFPENKQTPIAAWLRFASSVEAGELTADFNWRHREAEAWNITFETERGRLKLSEGGSRLFVDEQEITPGRDLGEHPSIYADFVDLIDERRSDADIRPLRLVADAYLAGRRRFVEPFES
ncbi:MAG: Gfo/Idh/MocA family oxidoreductase [Pseudomonadota bacterium]|nr:Gfo/Idh/MocA family oxidoreductase [Pseudomonadota bacterium]